MKKFIFVISLIILIFQVNTFASTSANYAITPEVISLGGEASMDSASLHLSSMIRDIIPISSTSSSFTLESRFTGITYGGGIVSTLEIPNIISIVPNTGLNDRSYKVIIYGSNISSDATAALQMTGQPDINATGEVIASDGISMECYFNLTGVAVGSWSVAVTNNGYGKTGIRGNAFTVSSAGPADIIGIPNNDPNPFDPSRGPTKFKYKLSSAATITLYLFNQRGELIWQKTYGPTENGGMAGDNDPTWDGVTAFRENVPTGVYVLRIVSKSGGSVRELGRIKVAVLR